MSTSPNKYNPKWIGRVTKELRSHNFSFKDFKDNPLFYCQINESYARNFTEKHPNPNKVFTWYNKQQTLNHYINTYHNTAYAKSFRTTYYSGN